MIQKKSHGLPVVKFTNYISLNKVNSSNKKGLCGQHQLEPSILLSFLLILSSNVVKTSFMYFHIFYFLAFIYIFGVMMVLIHWHIIRCYSLLSVLYLLFNVNNINCLAG